MQARAVGCGWILQESSTANGAEAARDGAAAWKSYAQEYLAGPQAQLPRHMVAVRKPQEETHPALASPTLTDARLKGNAHGVPGYRASMDAINS